jgi:ABC-type transport system involved in multi-copper enzyme maturation permease subunit
MNASLTRAGWIARITFLEAIRQRFFAFLLVLSAAMVVSSVSFRFMDFGHSELKFVADFAFGGMFLFGSVLALVMTAQLFFAEIDSRTALTLLAKPLSRTEFLLGKFIGIWAVLGVFVFSLAFLQGIILWSRAQELIVLATENGRVAPEFSSGGLATFALLQWFRLGVVAAMVLMVSAVARTFLFAVVVGAMTIVAGQLQWLAQEALLKPSEAGALTKGLLWLSSRVIPNLQQFNIGDTLVLDPKALPAEAIGPVVLSGAFYLVAFLALASLAFRRREI